MATTGIPNVIYEQVLAALPDLSGKCFAITGCTTGTGYWAAVAAARRNAACLLLLNRASARAAEAEKRLQAENPKVSVRTVDCDLQSLDSVRRAAAQTAAIAGEFGGLDALLNNAGVMAVPDTRTPDGFDVQMQTNHLSHFLLTKLLMPSLEAAAARRGEARVVQHSSGARREMAPGLSMLGAKYFQRQAPQALGGDEMPQCFARYHQTKLSNSVFAMALHERLQAAGSKIKSVCAEPGVSATNLVVNMGAGHREAAKAKPKEQKLKAAAKKKAGSTPNFGTMVPQSAADGACSLIEAAFASGADSGDFYMPKDFANNSATGLPVKCMTAGRATPFDESMRERFNGEALTTNRENHALLWSESETATEEFRLGGSKL